MTENGKLQEVADRLIEKTRTKEIVWNESFPSGSFMVSFPTHSVKIGPMREGGGILLSIHNEYGAPFAEASATSSGITSPGGPMLGSKIAELYRLAQANTVQETELDKLLEELREAS